MSRPRDRRRTTWAVEAELDVYKRQVAKVLVERVVAQLRSAGAEVATGHFGAMMAVSLVNQGPVTVLVET